MDRKFEELVIEVVEFEDEDIITDSNSCTCTYEMTEMPVPPSNG